MAISSLFLKLLCLLFVIYAQISASKDHQTITADPGQHVTLTCRASNDNIIVVEWSRADLKEKYVLLYRNKQFVPDEQHPSFKNRVDLQDRQMKDGDVSVILKDVTINDTGTYECRFPLESLDPISIINLSVVDPPGQTHTKDGVGRGRPGLSVFGVICIVVAAFVIFWKLKKSNSCLS